MDAQIGQILAVCHGKVPNPKKVNLNISTMETASAARPLLIVEGLNIHAQLGRWLRGFHAALYNEFLANETDHKFILPL